MKVLTIDVTGKNLIVAASCDEKIAERCSSNETKKHNSLVMPYIDQVLNELNITIKDIDVFSCVVGPGSFTGIRIGIATIKALAFATNKPCVSINSFEVCAYDKKDENFYVLIDALHDCCYAAKYNKSWDNELLKTYTTYSDVQNSNLPIYTKNYDSSGRVLINITVDKAKKEQFGLLEPLYLRKSQAERDLDGE